MRNQQLSNKTYIIPHIVEQYWYLVLFDSVCLFVNMKFRVVTHFKGLLTLNVLV